MEQQLCLSSICQSPKPKPNKLVVCFFVFELSILAKHGFNHNFNLFGSCDDLDLQFFSIIILTKNFID